MGTQQKINKLFGMTLYKREKDYNYKFQNYLGIISKEKYYKNYIETKTIKLFNKKIFTRIENEKTIEYNILDLIKKKTDKIEKTKKFLKRHIDNKYNKIFILKSNLGEAYLFLKFIINGLTDKKDIPIIIATKPAHLDLINMLTPQIDKKLINNLKYEINKKYMMLDNKVIYTAFPMKFYLDTEKKVETGKCHYLKEIYNYFKISKENIYKVNKIKINQNVKRNVNDYLDENNIKKFVFISTKANTCEELPKSFWKDLENSLKIRIIKNNEKFSLEESYYLGKRATAIISLRSGLSEILSETNNLHIVIYTNFKNRYRFNTISESKISKSYSINEIFPDKKSIYEIEYSKKHQEEIIKWVADTVNMRAK